MGKNKPEKETGKGSSAELNTKIKSGTKTPQKSRDVQGKSDTKKKQATRPMDPRFAAAQTDPRFERFPDRRRTVKIDPRFAGNHASSLEVTVVVTALYYCNGRLSV